MRIAGGAVVVALLLFVFSSVPAHKSVALKAKQGHWDISQRLINLKPGQGEESPDGQKSLFPVIESGRTAAKASHNGLIGEQDVEQTASVGQSSFLRKLCTRPAWTML